MFSMLSRSILAAGLAALLGACASSDGPRPSGSIPSGPTVISGTGTASLAAVSGPPGCAGPISEYIQIIDADAESGHLNPGVYNRVTTDLGPVKQACSAGREAEARSQLATVKARYGYR